MRDKGALLHPTLLARSVVPADTAIWFSFTFAPPIAPSHRSLPSSVACSAQREYEVYPRSSLSQLALLSAASLRARKPCEFSPTSCLIRLAFPQAWEQPVAPTEGVQIPFYHQLRPKLYRSRYYVGWGRSGQAVCVDQVILSDGRGPGPSGRRPVVGSHRQSRI